MIGSVARAAGPRHVGVSTAELPSRRNERGATAVEYALLASLIAGVIGFLVTGLGTQVQNLFISAVAMFP